LILIGTLNFADFQDIVNKLDITPEDKNELENLLKIATSQIPRYFNLLNSTKENWQIMITSQTPLRVLWRHMISE
jgi:hypothetical protein